MSISLIMPSSYLQQAFLLSFVLLSLFFFFVRVSFVGGLTFTEPNVPVNAPWVRKSALNTLLRACVRMHPGMDIPTTKEGAFKRSHGDMGFCRRVHSISLTSVRLVPHAHGLNVSHPFINLLSSPSLSFSLPPTFSTPSLHHRRS